MSAPPPICKRCGKCCESSSPTLHVSDLPAVANHHLDWARLYTVRKGEYVWDNINRKLAQASTEMIKVRQAGDGSCIYFNSKEKACTIYSHRPAECVALFCEDTSRFFEIYETPRLTRNYVIRDRSLVRLMEEQELRCPYDSLAEWVGRINSVGEQAVEKIIELLRFDYELRNIVRKKLGIPPSYLDLLFGRPMIQTIEAFGLRVIREDDGTFFLTVREHTK